jgi:hypothetical protein
MSLNFCNQKDRCPICGGGLDEYELRHKHPFHLNKDKCIDVLQNTIAEMSKNNDQDFEMLSYLLKDLTQEQIEEIENIISKQEVKRV